MKNLNLLKLTKSICKYVYNKFNPKKLEYIEIKQNKYVKKT